MRKYVSFILILVGIGIILYPKIKYEYFKSEEAKVIENWNKLSRQLELGEDEVEPVGENVGEEVEEIAEETVKEISITNSMDGIISIEKIQLYEAILKGSTETNLNIGVAKLDGCSEVGEVGNYVISGHRSRRYGRHFNRLNELEAGDEIEIITKDSSYKYEVYDKFVVKSEDVWVLKGNDKDKVITLITCDYSMKPTGRLIVKGKLVEN